MALTLRSAITANQTTFEVLGSDDLQPGDFKTIDSETIIIRTANPAVLQYGESFRYMVSVYRGSEGTRGATHAAAATLVTYSAGGGGPVTDLDVTATAPLTGTVHSVLEGLTDPASLPRGLYSGDPVTIADGANALLTWDTLGSGAALLDLTDPEQPTVVEGGIYSITAVAALDTVFTAGGAMQVDLHLDADDEDAVCEMTNGSAADFRVLTSLNVTYYIPTGGVVKVRLSNFDGAASRNFTLREAMVQMIARG